VNDWPVKRLLRRIAGEAGEAFGARPLSQQLGAVGAVVAAAIGGLLATRGALWLLAQGVRRLLGIARFWLLVVTLRLYRPCPDCHKYIHADARVCHRCGYRRRA
jgi:hypothetical protein